MSCALVREEALWIRLIADLLRLSRAYGQGGEGVRMLRCEAIIKAIEAFLGAHGPARGLVPLRVLQVARRRAQVLPAIASPAMVHVTWGDLAQRAEELAAFEDLGAVAFRPAKDLAGITGAILAMARTQMQTPAAPPVVRDLVTPFG
jgi:hypothetical protein